MDVHLADFCDHPGLFHCSILTVLAWKNAMGAMAKRHGRCHGSHGKKATMAKKRLEQNVMAPMSKNGHGPLKGIVSGPAPGRALGPGPGCGPGSLQPGPASTALGVGSNVLANRDIQVAVGVVGLRG